MAELSFRAFDADHHYYEAEDAFIRHIEPRMKKRCMDWAIVGGKKRLLVGGKVNRFIPNPTFDPVARPGCLDDYYQGKNGAGLSIRDAFGELEPIHVEYRDRAGKRIDFSDLEPFLYSREPRLGGRQGTEHALPWRTIDVANLLAIHAAGNRYEILQSRGRCG